MIPSPYEEHFGEVADPTSHEREIVAANQLLQEFLKDMDDGRVPRVTLVDIGRATDVRHCGRALHLVVEFKPHT